MAPRPPANGNTLLAVLLTAVIVEVGLWLAVASGEMREGARHDHAMWLLDRERSQLEAKWAAIRRERRLMRRIDFNRATDFPETILGQTRDQIAARFGPPLESRDGHDFYSSGGYFAMRYDFRFDNGRLAEVSVARGTSGDRSDPYEY